MRKTRATVPLLIALVALAVALVAGPSAAVDSATFVFDTTSDPGDLPDGPDYDVTGVNPIDDGSGCDEVVMVMVDPTGTPTDVDSFCLDLITALGGSDGDYGSFETGYNPVASPITYTLFDIDATDLAALSGFGDNDQEYFDYVVANGTCLDEQFFDETDLELPTGDAFVFCTAQATTTTTTAASTTTTAPATTTTTAPPPAAAPVQAEPDFTG